MKPTRLVCIEILSIIAHYRARNCKIAFDLNEADDSSHTIDTNH